jgi:hypothetical protein
MSKKTQKKAKDDTIPVTIRVPKLTHDILLNRSVEWDMSVSAIVRTIVMEVLVKDEKESKRMKSYCSMKARKIAKAIEKQTEVT